MIVRRPYRTARRHGPEAGSNARSPFGRGRQLRHANRRVVARRIERPLHDRTFEAFARRTPMPSCVVRARHLAQVALRHPRGEAAGNANHGGAARRRAGHLACVTAQQYRIQPRHAERQIDMSRLAPLPAVECPVRPRGGARHWRPQVDVATQGRRIDSSPHSIASPQDFLAAGRHHRNSASPQVCTIAGQHNRRPAKRVAAAKWQPQLGSSPRSVSEMRISRER